MHQAVKTVKAFQGQGAKAMTITGGGDPLIWRPLNEFIREFSTMELGLVTEGIHLDRLTAESMDRLRWCRVSMSAQHPHVDLDSLIDNCDGVAISYVVYGDDPFRDAENLDKIDAKYGKHVTHIRVVEDILDPSCTSVNGVKVICKGSHEKTIWQGRKDYTMGAKRCLVSLLKPNISPDGLVTPCCGVQYADNPPDLDFTKKFSMGTIDDINEIWDGQQYFDGSVCQRCYYSDYNSVLESVYEKKLKHELFV